MSYSFGVKAANKTAAKEAVAAKFDEVVVAHQPIHSRDRAAVLANANSAIELLADDDEKDVSVSVNGYVSWASGGVDDAALSSVTISASASHANREP
jgi:antibiotic biosynthesis monooxygenase (ABM) superfamily enzyme